MSPRWGSTPRLTGWLFDRQSQCDFDVDFDEKEYRTIVGRTGSSSGYGCQRRLDWEKKTSCVIWIYSETDKSVARIRLVKSENSGACVTVNCKACRSAIALYCLLFRVQCECVRGNKSKTPSIVTHKSWQYDNMLPSRTSKGYGRGEKSNGGMMISRENPLKRHEAQLSFECCSFTADASLFFPWHYSPSGPRPTSMKLSVSLRFFLVIDSR
jgi:hypothetical protein